NDDATYRPASLMKVPVMMAILKQSETNPDLLNKAITVTPEMYPLEIQNISPEETAQDNTTYTISELIRLMIVHSDNRSADILLNVMNKQEFAEILFDLDMPVPANPGDYAVSPRIYSIFFRALDNATYLNSANSEYALKLLSQTTFNAGITAGIDEDIVVAHKFGDGSVTTGATSTTELHDCGIFYTDNPYILCVMTKGSNLDSLKIPVAEMSKIVSDYLE
ncbi:MAG: class A beta-lactamase-related serine hydrolase, partial [Candidatus Uhrbacteria bacterium]|nr:class A beta-lactamase-related serine hydrolase [Candidatus Uhrbacteria bacterium]